MHYKLFVGKLVKLVKINNAKVKGVKIATVNLHNYIIISIFFKKKYKNRKK